MAKRSTSPASKNPQDYVIATMGSHTALQILHGARQEGMRNIVVCKKGSERVYKSYGVADEIILVNDWSEWEETEKKLVERNAIIIPHGSFIAYMGHDRVRKMKAMYFGTKEILEWEGDRSMERQGLRGAGGGFGYLIAKNSEQFYEVKNRKYPEQNDYALQEYIVGVPIYAHYFHSPLTQELEILSFDKRYESNADSIGRIRAEDQLAANIFTSYTIVGNIPVVVRESLLPEFFAMGERVVETSKKMCGGKGLFGSFCLECIVTRKLEIFVFEISARIVAGTNPFIMGSPYSWLKYQEPMSTGRRIAREIKLAIEAGRLQDVLG